MKDLVACCCLVSGFSACEEMNSMHQEYLDRGVVIYTGVVDSLKAYPGNERVKLTWEINADPRISKTVIYWNNRKDSSVVEVQRTQPGIMQMETILDLPENSYIFEIMTKDDEGHKSLKVEKTVEILGPDYTSTLRNREMVNIEALIGKEMLLKWNAVDSESLLYTLVKYVDSTDPNHPVEKEIKVENSEFKTILRGADLKGIIYVTSVYQPTNALDLFKANSKKYNLPTQLYPLSGNYHVLSGSTIDYSVHGMGIVDVSGKVYNILKGASEGHYLIPLALEGDAWKLGIGVNENNTLSLYVGKQNNPHVCIIDTQGLENYYDAEEDMFIINYRFTIEAWNKEELSDVHLRLKMKE